MTFFSVIIATLGPSYRPSLRDALRCLQQQSFKDFEVITDDSPPNEYFARNNVASRARGRILVFTDDDCTPPPDWLEKAYKHFTDKPWLKYLTGPIEGDLWGFGEWMRVSKPFWSIGANLFIEKEAFIDLGGFDWSWGLSPPPRGWRGDSDLMARFLKKYGYKHYIHADDVVMVHPKSMQSIWEPRVEAEFYKRHRSYVLRYIAPYDPRICQFVTNHGIERDPRVIRYLTHDQKGRLDWIRHEIHSIDYTLNGRTRILDVGGEDGFLFAGTGWEYTVIDVDLYDVPDGGFIRHDIDKPWPVGDESFDVVVIEDVLEHVENPEFALKEAYRVSRHLVLATIPNEYQWSSSKAPLITREERMRRNGFTDIDDMARHFTSKSPFLRELTSEKDKPHLWHIRWFRPDDVKQLVKPYENAEIGEINMGEWSWITVKIKKEGV